MAGGVAVSSAQSALSTALAAGAQLSHGILGICSTMLLAALMERTLFFLFRTRRSPRPLPSAARGLYGLFAWVGGIAPMAGLLGTVTGIMQALAGGRTDVSDQERMMRGVGFALAATAAGLLLAMGAFSGRALFGRRTEEIMQSAARRVS